MTTLSVFAPGTSMRWQGMAILLDLNPSDNAHNLNEPSAEHYYFFLDGLAARPNVNHPSASSVKFDPDNSDRLLSGVIAQTEAQRKRDQIFGLGMDQNAEAIHDLLVHIREVKNITEVNLIGFSRGAATCPKIARALYEDPALRDLPVNLLMMDPVAGPGHKKVKSIASVTPNVRKYLSQQSVGESLLFFEPMDKSRVTFESDKTKYLFLPVPEDHSMAVRWGVDLTREFLGAPDVLYKPDGLEAAQQILYDSRFPEPEETNQKQCIDVYRSARAKYQRQALSSQSDNPKEQRERNKQDIEAYYKQTFDKSHVASIQNDASEKKKKAQELSGYINSRRVTRELGRYTNARFFTNVLHESLFQITYPSLYCLIKKYDSSALESAREELSSMLKDTKAFFKNRHGIDENSSDKDFLVLSSAIKMSRDETNLKTGRELIEFMRPTPAGDVFSAKNFSEALKSARIQDLSFEQHHEQKVRYVVQNATQVKAWQSEIEGQSQPALHIIRVLQSKILDTHWNIRLGGIKVVLEGEDKTAHISHTMRDILDVISCENKKGKDADWDKVLNEIQAIGYCKALKKEYFIQFVRPKEIKEFYGFFKAAVPYAQSGKAAEKADGEGLQP